MTPVPRPQHMMAKTVRVLQRCRGHTHGECSQGLGRGPGASLGDGAEPSSLCPHPAPLSPLRNRSPHRPEDAKAVRISTCTSGVHQSDPYPGPG